MISCFPIIDNHSLAGELLPVTIIYYMQSKKHLRKNGKNSRRYRRVTARRTLTKKIKRRTRTKRSYVRQQRGGGLNTAAYLSKIVEAYDAAEGYDPVLTGSAAVFLYALAQGRADDAVIGTILSTEGDHITSDIDMLTEERDIQNIGGYSSTSKGPSSSKTFTNKSDPALQFDLTSSSIPKDTVTLPIRLSDSEEKDFKVLAPEKLIREYKGDDGLIELAKQRRKEAKISLLDGIKVSYSAEGEGDPRDSASDPVARSLF